MNFEKLNNYEDPAFTLAEVLITLGIIGVVAALTIPSLISNYKARKLHTQFLKSYSTIQQAYKLMQNDDVSMDPTTYNGFTNPFYKTFMKYIQAPSDCGYSGEHMGSNDYYKKINPVCFIRTSTKHYSNYTGDKNIGESLFDDGQIVLQDGTLLLFENGSNQNANSGRVFISVDLNGFNNPPNRWGYDLFTFQLIDEEIKTMGSTGTQYTDLDKYCNLKVSNNLNGIACAQKAKEDTDYFKKLIKEFK